MRRAGIGSCAAAPARLRRAEDTGELELHLLAFVLASPIGADPGLLARFLPDGPDWGGLIAAQTAVRPDDDPSTVIAALDAAFAMAQRAASVGVH